MRLVSRFLIIYTYQLEVHLLIDCIPLPDLWPLLHRVSPCTRSTIPTSCQETTSLYFTTQVDSGKCCGRFQNEETPSWAGLFSEAKLASCCVAPERSSILLDLLWIAHCLLHTELMFFVNWLWYPWFTHVLFFSALSLGCWISLCVCILCAALFRHY